jgi:hypothetical protein
MVAESLAYPESLRGRFLANRDLCNFTWESWKSLEAVAPSSVGCVPWSL